jgi:predicted nucleic acid-binding protein
MKTTEKNQEELERAVLKAAAVLANEQVAEIRHARRVESASLKLTAARSAKDDADFKLSFALLQWHGAKHMVMVCKGAIAKTGWKNSPNPEAEALMAVRKQLFSLPLGTDAANVLETAKEYGEKIAANWLVHQEALRISRDMAVAIKAELVARAAHVQAVQDVRLVGASFDLAEQEFRDVHMNPPKVLPNFGAQAALAQAAAELTGTELQQVAMSFFDTKTLGIVLAEDVSQ